MPPVATAAVRFKAVVLLSFIHLLLQLVLILVWLCGSVMPFRFGDACEKMVA